MKILGREPALILGALNALLMILGTVGLNWFNTDQAGLLIILINGGAAAITAFVTRPVAPAVFTAFVSSFIAFAGAYGINLPGETVAAINVAVFPILAFLTRGDVSPIESRLTNVTTAVGKPEVQTVPDSN